MPVDVARDDDLVPPPELHDHRAAPAVAAARLKPIDAAKSRKSISVLNVFELRI
jgi:hypothetical protein